MPKRNFNRTKPTGAKLPDSALVLLSHASCREDRMLLPPPTSFSARGAALQSILLKLLKQGLVGETAVNSSEQGWRSEEDGNRIGLQITDAGLTAIGVPALADLSKAEPGQEAEGRADVPLSAPEAGSATTTRNAVAPATHAGVKPGSKQALLIKELSRAAGATISHLVNALGWQPHTVRAALTGLRQRGYTVAREKNRKAETVYRATHPEPTGVDADA